MGQEHLLTDNPEAIAFGRARLAALRSAGMRYVTQVYDTPWGQVKVRIVGGIEYISAEPVGNLYLIFWQPAAGTSEAVFNDTIARHNKRLGPDAWFDRQVYTRGPGRYFVVGTTLPECKSFKLVRTFSDVEQGDENATNRRIKEYVFAAVLNNKILHWRRESTATGTDSTSTYTIPKEGTSYVRVTQTHHDRKVSDIRSIVWGTGVVASGERSLTEVSDRTEASIFDASGYVGPGGAPTGVISSESETISGVYGRSLTAGWDIYAHPTTTGHRRASSNTFVTPPVNESTSDWSIGWSYGKYSAIEPPKGADESKLLPPDPFDAIPAARHSFYPPVARERIDGGYNRMYLDLRPFGAGEFEARVIQCSKDYLYAAWEDGFIRARLGVVGGDPIPDPIYFELFGERGVAKDGNFPTAERYYTAFYNDFVTMVRGSRSDDPGQFSIVTTEFATGNSVVIEKRDLADLLPADVHLLGALREELANQPKPKEN